MAHLIKPSEVKIITKDGEIQVSIILDLNININSSNIEVLSVPKEEKSKKEENMWAIPDFESLPKINFGKKDNV